MPCKIWFITGTSSGFGRAMAELVLKNGDNVVATLRRPEAIASLTAQYTSDRLLVLKVDVTQPHDIEAAFAEAGKHFGRIDVVFNNAGYGALGLAENTPEDAARKLFDVNFWGAVNVSKQAVRFFREVNNPVGGRLLQNSSMMGIEGGAVTGYYVASKFALEGLTESLAAEVDPEWNIKITLVEPGWFRTDGITANAVQFPLHPAYDKPNLPASVIHKYLSDSPVIKGNVLKAVEAIYRAANLPNPPQHLPLGRDSIDLVKRKAARLLKDTNEYESWSNGLDTEL